MIAQLCFLPCKMLDRIRAMIAECAAKGEGQDEKRALAESIVKQLKDGNFATEDVIKHSKIAVHPDNRHGVGVDPLDAHALLGRICRDGFSQEELGVRWCFEKCREGQRAAN